MFNFIVRAILEIVFSQKTIDFQINKTIVSTDQRVQALLNIRLPLATTNIVLFIVTDLILTFVMSAFVIRSQVLNIVSDKELDKNKDVFKAIKIKLVITLIFLVILDITGLVCLNLGSTTSHINFLIGQIHVCVTFFLLDLVRNGIKAAKKKERSENRVPIEF